MQGPSAAAPADRVASWAAASIAAAAAAAAAALAALPPTDANVRFAPSRCPSPLKDNLPVEMTRCIMGDKRESCGSGLKAEPPLS